MPQYQEMRCGSITRDVLCRAWGVAHSLGGFVDLSSLILNTFPVRHRYACAQLSPRYVHDTRRRGDQPRKIMRTVHHIVVLVHQRRQTALKPNESATLRAKVSARCVRSMCRYGVCRL